MQGPFTRRSVRGTDPTPDHAHPAFLTVFATTPSENKKRKEFTSHHGSKDAFDVVKLDEIIGLS